MNLKSLFIVLILCLFSGLIFAVPGNGKLRMTPVGVFCLKEGEKKTSTVFWDASILDENNHTWKATGGSITISPNVNFRDTFAPELGKYEIEFYEPGVYTVTVKIIWTYCDLTEERTEIFNISLVDLKAVTIKDAPDYVPSNLDGLGNEITVPEFELEKGDSFTLKAITNPSGFDSYISWSGDGVSGTGGSKTISYSTTGVKYVNVTFLRCSISIKIYVNDNKSSPMKLLKISWDKKWAHCLDESISLTADGVDFDWELGEFSEVNKMDWVRTEWSIPPGRGTFEPNFGKEVKWTPSATTGGTFITAIFHNFDEPIYTPRNDESKYSDPTEFGAFKVYVERTISVSGGGEEKTTLDEDGKVVGVINSEHSGKLKAEAKEPKKIGSTTQVDKSLKVMAVWKYLTIPTEAEPSKPIKADLTVEGSASFFARVLDGDEWDDPISIEVGLSGGSEGISFGLSVDIQVTGEDDDEGTAIAAAFFKSDDNNFTQILPESASSKLEVTSNPWLDGLPHSEGKGWSKSAETKTNSRRKDETVSVIFIFHAEARAKDEGFFFRDYVQTEALAEVEKIKVKTSFKNVSYDN